jgi:hypothetical protein
MHYNELTFYHLEDALDSLLATIREVAPELYDILCLSHESCISLTHL